MRRGEKGSDVARGLAEGDKSKSLLNESSCPGAKADIEQKYKLGGKGHSGGPICPTT